jgi:hypothetical protein
VIIIHSCTKKLEGIIFLHRQYKEGLSNCLFRPHLLMARIFSSYKIQLKKRISLFSEALYYLVLLSAIAVSPKRILDNELYETKDEICVTKRLKICMFNLMYCYRY